jgi:hypothetical protein
MQHQSLAPNPEVDSFVPSAVGCAPLGSSVPLVDGRGRNIEEISLAPTPTPTPSPVGAVGQAPPPLERPHTRLHDGIRHP